MPNISGIYAITNKVNGKIYVGSSNNIYYRWKSHKSYLNNGLHTNAHLQSAWQKYGKDSFEFSVLEKCNVESLIEREQHHMDTYDTLNPEKGYNKREAEQNSTMSEETRRRMSEAKKGKKQSPELIRKRAEGMKGHAVSAETRAKQSEAAKKRPKRTLSEEHKQKLREAGFRRVYTDEQKQALSEKFKGKPRSEETKQKVRETWAKKRGE